MPNSPISPRLTTCRQDARPLRVRQVRHDVALQLAVRVDLRQAVARHGRAAAVGAVPRVVAGGGRRAAKRRRARQQLRSSTDGPRAVRHRQRPARPVRAPSSCPRSRAAHARPTRPFLARFCSLGHAPALASHDRASAHLSPPRLPSLMTPPHSLLRPSPPLPPPLLPHYPPNPRALASLTRASLSCVAPPSLPPSSSDTHRRGGRRCDAAAPLTRSSSRSSAAAPPTAPPPTGS